MLFRERDTETLNRGPGNPTATGDGGNNLEQQRQAAERFLSASDDAIANALSGDSAAYLSATRQSGGE